MIKIPNDNRTFRTSNQSSVLGNLDETFALDLSRDRGKINFTKAEMTENLTAEITGNPIDAYIVDYAYYEATYFAIAAGTVIRNTDPIDGSWTEPSWTNLQTGIDNGEGCLQVFNDNLYVFGDNSVRKITNDSDTTWSTVTSDGDGLASAVFDNRCYFTDASKDVISFNTAETVSTSGAFTLSLNGFPGSLSITFIKATSNRLWVGVQDSSGNEGAVFEWDGVTADTPIRRYPIDAHGAMAGVVRDDILYILDSRGRLQRFAGNGFSVVDTLPFLNETPTGYGSQTDQTMLIGRNGMDILPNKNIVMNINSGMADANDNDTLFPSGVWEWDPEYGMFHRAPLVYNDGSGQHQPHHYVRRIGAIITSKDGDQELLDDGFMSYSATLTLEDDSSASDIGVACHLEAPRKTGYSGYGISYFTTPEIHSTEVTDTYEKIYLKYKKLYSSSDKYVVKYRTDVELPDQMKVTWSSTTQFTSTDGTFANYVVGDEVTVLFGSGAGMISHITAISEAAGTYTVTLDETHDVTATDTAQVRLEKWVKLPEITQDNLKYAERRIGKKDTLIKLKVVFYHYSGRNEFHQLQLVNLPDKPSI